MSITDTLSKSERLTARVTPEIKSLISEAAALRGQTITEFLVASAQSAAQTTLTDQRLIRLSGADQSRLMDLLIDPPAANSALKEAMADYQETKSFKQFRSQ